jgi:hypothetical protein
MGIRIGDQVISSSADSRQFISGPREPGLDGPDVLGFLLVAFLDRVKTRIGAEDGEPGGPGMAGMRRHSGDRSRIIFTDPAENPKIGRPSDPVLPYWKGGC